MSLPVKSILRLVAQNKNMHVLCRSISRGADGQWKTFVDSRWILGLPEFAKGFPEKIPYEHRKDENALYFGPGRHTNIGWWEADKLQLSIDALLGGQLYTYTARNFPRLSDRKVEVDEEGLSLGNYYWPFDKEGFMPLVLKHEPFDPESLQVYHTKELSELGGYVACRIVTPHREFYAMMEVL